MTTATKEIPILFSGPMVNAIRAGRKTVTRRVVDLRHVLSPEQKKLGFEQCEDPAYFRPSLLVKGVPRLTVPVRHPLDGHLPWDACDGNCEYARWAIGDHLWVRENFLYRNQRQSVLYQADFNPVEASGVGAMYGGWKPSIHLPRKFCRLVLEVEDVGVERLHEISEEDAQAEGFAPWHHRSEGLLTGKRQFAELWETLNADRGFPFSSNCYVWRVQFKVVEGLA